MNLLPRPTSPMDQPPVWLRFYNVCLPAWGILGWFNPYYVASPDCGHIHVAWGKSPLGDNIFVCNNDVSTLILDSNETYRSKQ